MGHPVLRGRAMPVPDPTDPEVEALVRDMIDTMIDANGAGLAAPQIYEPWRIVVFQAPLDRAPEDRTGEEAYDHTAPLTVLINPEIEILTSTREEGWEGCLSVPDLRGLVPRYTHLKYRGFGLDGSLIERRARGFHARVVQHECDHLDGVLYPQRMEDISTLMYTSEVSAYLGVKEKMDE
jgi:peptide deformylase